MLNLSCSGAGAVGGPARMPQVRGIGSVNKAAVSDGGVRGVTTDDRLLRVLRALNQLAPCTVLDLYRATGISRQAIYRAVDHLGRQGYVQRIPGDGRIRLTSEVRALSAGYRDDDWIV